ncbi:C-terminal binding protein [Oceanobacillus jeddahense]|uniref:C-terminal binding protein n=1 Tax=Oceanobacillus jeddahense TaxID=1462527 RepID=UPI0005961838|nr:C-terminal binding protein [Oceanobacillus jeddahense]
MKKAIVVDKDYGSVTIDDLNILKEKFKEESIELELKHFYSEDEIISECQEAEAILGTGNPPMSEKVISKLPNLKMIQRFGIGVNSINLSAATENHKIVSYMPGFCLDELAAHATSMILSLIRNTAYYDRRIRQGEWPKAEYYTPKSISEMTIGLYGFGGSAKELYKIFNGGFQSRVIACDPYVSEEIKEMFNIDFVDFHTMLKESDVVSLHAPLNTETRHIFNEEAFKKMKNDAMIINVARGPLIDEDALVDALKTREIRFAGLDVFENEPLDKKSKLRNMENVILTSHSAFYGEGSKQKQLKWAFELVSQVLNRNTIKKEFIANKEIFDTNIKMTFK